MLLSARNLVRIFGRGPNQVMALKGISFDIAAGDYVAIMGPSGSGKSTLLNILGLLDRPSDGILMLQGEDLAPIKDKDLAARRAATIGFVFQAYNLLARQTALENVEMPLVYARCSRRARHQMALSALRSVGLEAKAHRLPCELSGGEQQRVAIARALVRDPPLLLADEPTGALDAVTTREILGVLETLNAAGRAVVLITHDESVGARAQRMFRLRDGGLMAEGRLQ